MQVLTTKEVSKDIDLILWSAKLSDIYRYTYQRYWERETFEHEHALRIEGFDEKGNKVPRVESVAEHSWHIADIIMVIGPRFPGLDISKCLMYAILHDKLEIITGDKNPLGKDGKGKNTHAFNPSKRISKDEAEKLAFEKYKKKLNSYALPIQEVVLKDIIDLTTSESRFVKAIDKIQTLTFILRKKKGIMLDEHISFTIKYSGTYRKYYPQIEPYYTELINRLFTMVGKMRSVNPEELKKQFYTEQLDLFD